MIRGGLSHTARIALRLLLDPRSPAAVYRNPLVAASLAYVRAANLALRCLRPLGARVECLVCGKKHFAFGATAAVSVVHITSGNLCLFCGSNARTRTALFCLRGLLAPAGGSALDIGPLASTRRFFQRLAPQYRYETLDAFGQADHMDDVADMASVGDAVFDFVLCVHVLEHVPNDLEAMREIARVLKPGGTAVIMVPQVEGAPETRRSDRKPFLGYGHVWLYGDDFPQRLESCGLRVRVWSVADAGAARRYGLAGDRVFLAQKGAGDRPPGGCAHPPAIERERCRM